MTLLALLPAKARLIAALLALLAPAFGAPTVVFASPGADEDGTAAYQEGLKYLQGKEVPPDEQKAYELLQSAAARGHGEALGSIGYFYSTGKVVEKDDAKARQYFVRAAEKGSAGAQINLGRFLLDGRGGAKDPAAGVASYEQAVRQGSKTAALALGEIYYWGEHADGVPDYPRAFALLKGLAEAGQAHAQNMLGVMIKDQRIAGLPPEAGREWLLKAALQGHGKACSNLGQWGLEAPDRTARIEGLKWLLVARHLKEITAIYVLDDEEKLIKPDELQAAQPQAAQIIQRLELK